MLGVDAVPRRPLNGPCGSTSGLKRACSARFSGGYVLLLDAVDQQQAIALGAAYAGPAFAASVLVLQRGDVTD